MNFSAVKQFFKPLTDDQVRVLARKHAGTPGIEQSVYLDEVGLQGIAVEVCERRVSVQAKGEQMMTEPHQRTRAILKTMRFLEELTRPGDTPRVPAHIRDTARRLLQHYPGVQDIEVAHKALPEVFGPVVQRQAEGMPTPVKRGKSGD